MAHAPKRNILTGGAGFMQAPRCRARLLAAFGLALLAVPGLAATAPEAPRNAPVSAAETPLAQAQSDAKASPGRRARPAVALAPSSPPPEFRGPDITLIASEERMVYEYRQNGQLRMIKVVPKAGKPYYLVPYDRTRGFGDLEQAKTLVAEWVLWEF